MLFKRITIILFLAMMIFIAGCSSIFDSISGSYYTVNIDVIGNGTVEPFYNSSQFVEKNGELTLEAIPSEGEHFIEWKGSLTGTETKKTITVTAEMDIVAVFSESGVITNPSDSYLYFNDNVRRPSEAGALQILEHNGIMTLADQYGDPIQLRGMSTHGLQWFPEIINDNAFAALANDWESNVIRLAMYVGENGYAYNPEVKDRVIEGIELAIAHDMYVIVDWHVHAPGDPTDPIYSGAMDFFEDISSRYPNHPNIIYELANEPSNNTNGGNGIPNNAEGWQVVKEYSEELIEMLRDNGNENLIIVGNPNWCQRPDLAADDPIDDKNTIYSFHFYSGTHAAEPEAYVMNNVIYAMQNGLALFVSEWGTSEATGDGGPYLEEAGEWIKFLNANNISWVNWSLTNKNETSGAFTPFVMGISDATDLDPGADQVWEMEELSVSGEYVRTRIKGDYYIPIEREEIDIPIDHDDLGVSTLPSDFENGTRQGWRWNSNSGVIGSLTIEEANASNALSWELAYPEVKPSDGWASAAWLELYFDNLVRGNNDYLAFDYYIDPVRANEGSIEIHLVFQPPTSGYWAQSLDSFVIELDSIDPSNVTSDGLYHYEVEIDINNISVDDNEQLRNMILIFADVESDFAGRMYMDNVRFESFEDDEDEEDFEIIHDFEDEEEALSIWWWHGGVSIKEANGSNALSWEVTYPDDKPDDGWASAPRIESARRPGTIIPGHNNHFAFDFYLEPERASTGFININLVFYPNGTWTQVIDTFTIDLSKLDLVTVTPDGLYHYEVKIDITDVDRENFVIKEDTDLLKILLIYQDIESDFSGRMYMDNLRFENHESKDNEDEIEEPIEHAPLGISIFPSDFEDGTRQGWDWDSGSGVQGSLTIEDIGESNALSWEVEYPKEKDEDDNWTSASRFDFSMRNLLLADNDSFVFDFYLEPERANEGSIKVHLAFGPPQAGYWAQAEDYFEIDLTRLDSAPVVDGLYHYEVKISLTDFDANEDDFEIQGDIDLWSIALIFEDGESDFSGRMYMDNVRFEKHNSEEDFEIIHDFEDEEEALSIWWWHGGVSIKEANGSNALTWEVTYPDDKPDDGWASAPRIESARRPGTIIPGQNNHFAFDFYLEPDRASTGFININLVFYPNGTWTQVIDTFTIDLSKLDLVTVTPDGLYHYEVKIDINDVDRENFVIEENTDLLKILLVFQDIGSDFSGRMYMDNLRFE